jgi:hypothetical protein
LKRTLSTLQKTSLQHPDYIIPLAQNYPELVLPILTLAAAEDPAWSKNCIHLLAKLAPLHTDGKRCFKKINCNKTKKIRVKSTLDINKKCCLGLRKINCVWWTARSKTLLNAGLQMPKECVHLQQCCWNQFTRF